MFTSARSARQPKIVNRRQETVDRPRGSMIQSEREERWSLNHASHSSEHLVNSCPPLVMYHYSFTFVIFPLILFPHERFPREAVDITVYLLVLDQQQNPVLFVEIKDDSWARGSNARLAADAQMRQQYDKYG
jgi:predicted class III extradiol MEMO1 family dioxygenase